MDKNLEPTTRLTAVWRSAGNLDLLSQNIPNLGDKEVLIKVRACTICGSDIRIFNHGNDRVESGQIVGHEIAGEVHKVGALVNEWKPGDRVSIGADVPCATCVHCIEGRPNCCETNYAIGHQFEGGFSEYMILNEITLSVGPIRRLSKEIRYEMAALAEPLACCINGYERCFVSPGRSVVIFGAGPIGIMLAMLGRYYDACRIVVVEPNADRLKKAEELEIADVYINPSSKDPVTEISRITSSQGADIVFTACPVPDVHEQAIQIVGKRGFVNFFGGLPKGARSINLESNTLHYREAYVTGSHGSTPAQHSLAVDLIERGILKLDKLVTDSFPLSEINKAYQKAASGEAIKVVVTPHDNEVKERI